MNEFELQFNGYWRYQNRMGIPDASGIYLVYRAKYNEKENTVGLLEIIYIGQAASMRERISTHEKISEFNQELLQGEELCFACAEVSEHLDEVENALIFAQKPKLNENLKDRYKYKIPAKFKIDGKCILLKYTDFSIK